MKPLPLPFSSLRAACLPFVARTLRGARLQKTMLVAVLLGVAALVFGTWFALGSGDLEHEIRTELAFEEQTWFREQREFVLLAMSEHEHHALQGERDDIASGFVLAHETYGRVAYAIREGVSTLRTATSIGAPPAYASLQAEARALLDRTPVEGFGDIGGEFSWQSPDHVERLRTIVARSLVPGIERYHSPLGLLETTRMIGAVAGGVLAFLLLIVAPLLAGMGVAQEVHENTLQPLTGTALTPRQLVVGLTAGPWAQVGLLALPQLAILAVTSPFGLAPLAVVGAIVLFVVAGLFLSIAAELVALAIGRRSATGLASVWLGSALGLGFLIAFGTALARAEGLTTLMPQLGGLQLLVASFLPTPTWRAVGIDVLPIVAAATSLAVLTVFAVLAFERRIAGRTRPALGRIEANVVAMTLVLMVVMFVLEAGPTRVPAKLVVTLGLLAMPFQVLLAARVARGEGTLVPRLPVASLLLEFAGFVALAAIAVPLAAGVEGTAGPWGLVHITWALGVAALAALRTAVPRKRATTLWVVLCLAMAAFEYTVGAERFVEPYRSTTALSLFGLGVLPGLVELALMIYVPWSLLRPLLPARSTGTSAGS